MTETVNKLKSLASVIAFSRNCFPPNSLELYHIHIRAVSFFTRPVQELMNRYVLRGTHKVLVVPSLSRAVYHLLTRAVSSPILVVDRIFDFLFLVKLHTLTCKDEPKWKAFRSDILYYWCSFAPKSHGSLMGEEK